MIEPEKSALVSVGLPVVKTHYLDASLSQCLKQTYKNIEVIIVNNASNEKTKKEIKSVVDGYNDKRIKYYENENAQLPMVENWNKTLSYSEGKYFSLLCDDDKWDVHFLEKMVSLAETHPETNLFHSRVLIINENDKPIELTTTCYEKEDYLDFIYHRIKRLRSQFLSDFFVRTSEIKKIGGFIYMPDGWGSDDVTWFTLAVNGGVAYTPETLYYYRTNPFSYTNSKYIKNKYTSIAKYVEIVGQLVSKTTEDDFDKLRVELIKSELKDYARLNYLYQTDNYLRGNPFVPNILIPFIRMIIKLYKKIFGW